MELTSGQIQALAHGEAVCVEVSGANYVLIREEVYERVRAILDIEAAYPLTDESFRDGWQAPGMEDYDRYEELRRP